MYYSKEPISLHEAVRIVPALAQQEQHSSRSYQYEHVPTIAVLAALQQQGFNIHGLQQANTRDESREGFQKHMIRLRKSGDLRKVGDECPEVVLVNSHDGSSAYQLSSGFIVLICENGCVVGNEWGSFKIKHQGAGTIHNVIEGTFKTVETFDTVMGNVDTLKQITLDEDEQEYFARKALALRFEEEDRSPVTSAALLYSRRDADIGNSLWKVYNRVQENITKGGLKGRRVDDQGRFRKTTLKGIKGIDGNLALNRSLWALAEEMAASKGVQLLSPPTAVRAA